MEKHGFFISGATGGFGRMAAVECASRGYQLFLTDQKRAKASKLSAGLYKAITAYRRIMPPAIWAILTRARV